jgi:hypothetical protein
VSDRLKQSLMSSRNEIEAGLAEAETELSRVRQRARELEELIALGTATLLAAEMISGSKPASSSSSSAPRAAAASDVSVDPKAAADLAAANEKSKDELQSRLSKAQK